MYLYYHEFLVCQPLHDNFYSAGEVGKQRYLRHVP
ncbi:hypothetical protein CBSLWZGG_CDS8 [Pseudomonas phage PseuPha1]|nr:hypothetical protein CBSLWZGG_CDS8 [Pseudomonas phage PseuPha1]